jgi:hypothetical protein
LRGTNKSKITERKAAASFKILKPERISFTMKGLLFLLEIGVWVFLFVLIITRTATEKDYVQLALGILLLILRCAKIVKDKWL